MKVSIVCLLAFALIEQVYAQFDFNEDECDADDIRRMIRNGLFDSTSSSSFSSNRNDYSPFHGHSHRRNTFIHVHSRPMVVRNPSWSHASSSHERCGRRRQCTHCTHSTHCHDVTTERPTATTQKPTTTTTKKPTTTTTPKPTTTTTTPKPTTPKSTTTTPKPTTTTTPKPTTTTTTPKPTTTTTPKLTTTKEPTTGGEGPCESVSHDCRFGIISAKECCKGVPESQDVLLQNNDDCGTYFQCVHGVPVIRDCSEGLKWNAYLCRCDWPQNSSCK